MAARPTAVRNGTLAVALSLVVDLAIAAELSGYLVLTTDYVFRGVTYSDGDPAARLGADLAFDSGLYLGVWASTIDIDSGAIARRDHEVDYYVGYARTVGERWTLGANAVAYTFPGAEGVVDYDYAEYSLSANYDDRTWLEYSYSPDIFNTGLETHNIALFAEWQLTAQINAGAGVGYYDVSELSGDGYTYWELGITRPFRRIELDLRYHDASGWVRIISDADRVGSRLVLSARVQF